MTKQVSGQIFDTILQMVKEFPHRASSEDILHAVGQYKIIFTFFFLLIYFLYKISSSMFIFFMNKNFGK